jgi:hypothetical protein
MTMPMLGRAKRVHIDKKSTTIIAERVVHTQSFFSLTSTSVAPPARITATPQASLAKRSWTLSRS